MKKHQHLRADMGHRSEEQIVVCRVLLDVVALHAGVYSAVAVEAVVLEQLLE